MSQSMARPSSASPKGLRLARWLVLSMRLSFLAFFSVSLHRCSALLRNSGIRSNAAKFGAFSPSDQFALSPFLGGGQRHSGGTPPWNPLRHLNARLASSEEGKAVAFLQAPPRAFGGRGCSSASSTGAPLSAASEAASSSREKALFPLAAPPALAPSVASAKTPEAFDAAKDLIETEYWRLFKRPGEGQKKLSETQTLQLLGFAKEYCEAAKVSGKVNAQECVNLMVGLIQQCTAQAGHQFPPFGKRIHHPLDFFSWALSIWKPLIDKAVLLADDSLLKTIESHVRTGGNIVFLSNHQTEPDPAVLQWMLEQRGFSFLADKIVAVAGDRVRSDPLSTPFSMGMNMICVFSKKHMSSDPLQRQVQQQQNLLAMQQLQLLLQTGQGVVWVAPSGGRDRPDTAGHFSRPDNFDPKTIQMFYIHGLKAKEAADRDTLFVPLALFTAPICPPPKEVSHALGESRHCAFASVFAALGQPLAVSLGKDRIITEAQEQVQRLYQQILEAKAASEAERKTGAAASRNREEI